MDLFLTLPALAYDFSRFLKPPRLGVSSRTNLVGLGKTAWFTLVAVTGAMWMDPEVVLSAAGRVDAMADELEALLVPAEASFPSWQGAVAAGLGPAGAPFTASWLAATSNHLVAARASLMSLRAWAEGVREAVAHYTGTDAQNAELLGMLDQLPDELKDQLPLEAGDRIAATEAALPAFLKDDLEPLEPGDTRFVRDIASTRDPAGHAGIKGADLGIPAKLSDGTPVLLFGDCNKPGDNQANGYYGGIVAATVENTPDGVRVTGIAGWGPGELLADHALADKHNYYPSGVITMADGRQLLTVANVDVSNESGEPFVPVSSHMVQIGGASGNWQSVSTSMGADEGFSYATGEQVGNTVYVAAGANDAGPINLYEIPADKITDRSSWDQYKVDGPSISGWGGTPQIAKVGDQWALSYVEGSQLLVRVADSPGDFGVVVAQHVDIAGAGSYPNPPGVGAVYGGYVLADSTPDDLRFGVSYYNDNPAENGEPYGVGEWRFRPNQ